MNVFLASASFASEGTAFFWAMIGGFVVALGLIIEEVASRLDERYFAPLFKPHAKLRFAGWCILMVGICIETADAGWTAHEIRISDAKNNPANQPIGFVSATARLVVRGTNFWNLDPAKFPDNQFVTLSFARSDQVINRNWALRLVCKNFEKFGNADSTEWDLEFGINPSGLYLSNLTTNDLVRTADKWDIVVLQADFLRSNTEILKGGQANVSINSTVKHFPIPPQFANPMYGPSPPLKGSAISNSVNVMVQSGP